MLTIGVGNGGCGTTGNHDSGDGNRSGSSRAQGIGNGPLEHAGLVLPRPTIETARRPDRRGSGGTRGSAGRTFAPGRACRRLLLESLPGHVVEQDVQLRELLLAHG